MQWYALIIRLNSDYWCYIGRYFLAKNVMVYCWGLFLVKKCNGVKLSTKIWSEKYCFVIVVLLTTHIAILWSRVTFYYKSHALAPNTSKTQDILFPSCASHFTSRVFRNPRHHPYRDLPDNPTLGRVRPLLYHSFILNAVWYGLTTLMVCDPHYS